MSELSKGLKAFEPGMSLSEIERQSVKAAVVKKPSEGKIDYTLVPPYALEEMARVLTMNLRAYPDPDNWKKIPNNKKEFDKSLRRHVASHSKGNIHDPESLEPKAYELAAIMINAAFLLEMHLNPDFKQGGKYYQPTEAKE